MTKTQMPVLTAVRMRSRSLQSEVMAKKMGIPPKGSTMGNKARNVAAADAGSERRMWPSTWAEFIRSGLERIYDLHSQMQEVSLVPGRDGETVNPGSRGNHSICG